jgi:hypothetical protein
VNAKSRAKRQQAKADGPLELVVRRGALRRYRQLKEKTRAWPVKILWDLRKSDRRMAPAPPEKEDEQQSGAPREEQRKGERRQAPPYTWDVADFLVIGRPRKRRSGKKK